jgi:hypothetical protein
MSFAISYYIALPECDPDFIGRTEGEAAPGRENGLNTGGKRLPGQPLNALRFP